MPLEDRSSSASGGTALVGRVDVLATLAGALDGIGRSGRSYVLSGEPGIGKTTLLRAARELAAARGIRVLDTAGAQYEVELPFAALVGMVKPVHDLVPRLPASYQRALLAALGEDTGEPSRFVVSLGLLELLSEAAAERGLLVLVDDAHVLDPASREALGFVTRRIGDEPIVVLAARRSNHAWPPGLAGDELPVGPLTAAESAELLDRMPGLPARHRRQVLDLARGNPLALLELPAAPAGAGPAAQDTVALTDRLERAFADRHAGLPEPSRAVLLAGIANDGGTLAETLAAAEVIAGRPVSVDDLQPAIEADLVRVEGMSLRFRHPLVGSAVWQSAPYARTHAVHAALGRVVADHDRRTLHRALAALDRDDAVAGDLDRVAGRARSRGAPAAALRLTELAADLSADPAARVNRLMQALEIAVEVGRRDRGDRLARLLQAAPLTDSQAARLAWVRELREDRIELDPATVFTLVELARSCHGRGEPGMALQLLRSAAHRCWWRPGDHRPGDAVAEAAAALPVGEDSAPMLFVRIAVRSGTDGDAVRAALTQDSYGFEASGAVRQLQGLTAQFAGDPALAGRLFGDAEAIYREHGQLGLLAPTLVSHSVAAVLAGQFRLARDLTAEAVRLAQDTSSLRWQTAAQLASAAADACLDPARPAAPLSDGPLDELANPAQWAQLAHTQGLAALSRGDDAAAFAVLRAMQTPGDRCYHETYRTWVVADLTEAAVRAGHADEAAEIVAGLGSVPCPSPMLSLGLTYARAVLAPPPQQEDRFRAALADDRLAAFPFLHARCLLEYGSWLRRRRRRTDALSPLRRARDILQGSGVQTWAERARQELAAAGEASPARPDDRLGRLTPQELVIARLAAQGLSNREIAAQLFLSHRTVGSHLYRIFPKLGLTSRVQLVEAVRPSG